VEPRKSAFSWRPLLAGILLLAPIAARASENDSPAETKPPQTYIADRALGRPDPYTGAFKQSIHFEVPQYHGIEPQLNLIYDSAGGNDIAGLGGRLSGFTQIELASPGRGTPFKDIALNRYYLDGQELVPCRINGVSPSCTNPDDSGLQGDYYSTEIESFLRIKHEVGPKDRWIIWNTVGTKTFLEQSADSGGLWQLASVEDTHGNVVRYSYSNAVCGASVPSQIAYNGATVEFGYDYVRPDRFWTSFSLSVSSCSRLRMVKVSVNGQVQRAYALSYLPSRNRSKLSTVQEFGYDAVFDMGLVVGGTSFPPITFHWPLEGAHVRTTSHHVSPGAEDLNAKGHERIILGDNMGGFDVVRVQGDFDGDERADFIAFQGGKSTLPVYFSNGDGTFRKTDLYSPGLENIPWPSLTDESPKVLREIFFRRRVKLGDFNGDGKTDFASYDYPRNELQVMLSNGDGTFRRTVQSIQSDNLISKLYWASGMSYVEFPEMVAGDFNGDGRTDLLFRSSYDWAGHLAVLISKGDGVFEPYAVPLPGTEPLLYAFDGRWIGENLLGGQGIKRITVGDYNGDGRADVLGVRRTARHDELEAIVLMTRPDKGFDAIISTIYTSLNPFGMYEVLPGDFNGDGRSDFALRIYEGEYFLVALSRGDGTFDVSNTKSVEFGEINRMCSHYGSGDRCHNMVQLPLLGDFNGDSRTDIALIPQLLGEAFGYSLDGNPKKLADAQHNVTIFLSRGDGSFSHEVIATDPFFTAEGECYLWGIGLEPWGRLIRFDGMAEAGDFNGDGMTDFLLDDVRFADLPETPGYYTGDLRTEESRNANVFLVNPEDYHGYSARVYQVDNGYGASVKISYAPSSHYQNNGYVPLRHVVNSIEVTDGNGGVSNTTFDYKGGRYSFAMRRFLGFEYVKETHPCNFAEQACPYSETWYRLNEHSETLPLWEYRKAGNGALLALTFHEYSTTRKLGDPYLTLETGVSEMVFDGSENACRDPSIGSFYLGPGGGGYGSFPCDHGRRSGVYREFDSFGNVTNENRFTDAGGGDSPAIANRWVKTFYVPNTRAYITSLPATITVTENAVMADPTISQTLFHYDEPPGTIGGTDVPPVKGDLTSKELWLDMPVGYGNDPIPWVFDAVAPYYSQRFEYWYDAYGNLTREIDPLGFSKSTEYDTTYHVIPVIKTNNLQQAAFMTPHSVCFGQIEAVVDLNGQTSWTEYDALCRPKFVLTPLLEWETYNYCTPAEFTGSDWNVCGKVGFQRVEVSSPSADGIGLQYSRSYFDGLGRTIVAVQRGVADQGGDIVTVKGYQPRGMLAYESLPVYADVGGLLLGASHAGEAAAARFKTRYSYDAADRLTRIQYPDGKTVDKVYGFAQMDTTDGSGKYSELTPVKQTLSFVRTTDEAGSNIDYYDALNRLAIRATGTGQSGERTVYYGYDSRDNMTVVLDCGAAGMSNVDREWKLQYDSLGRLRMRDDPDRGHWDYVYDARNQLVLQSDAKGQVTRFEYDALGRTTRETRLYGRPLEASTVTWSYDRNSDYSSTNVGYVTAQHSPNGSAHFDYDAHGRLVRKEQSILCGGAECAGSPYVFQYSYDGTGRLKTKTYPDGWVMGPIVYDSAGRIRSIPEVLNEATYWAFGPTQYQSNNNGTATSYDYDSRGMLTTIVSVPPPGQGKYFQVAGNLLDVRGRATNSWNTTLQATGQFLQEDWSYQYDSSDRLYQVTGGDGSSNVTYNFGYDTNGLYSSKTRTDSSSLTFEQYIYRAPWEQHPHAIARVLTYAYDGSGASSLIEKGYDYDANGDLTQETRGAATRTIEYDGARRPVRISDSDTSGHRSDFSMWYDGDGRRLGKTVNGALTTVYPDDDYEFEPQSKRHSVYVHFAGRVIAKREHQEGGDVAIKWLHTNRLGSVEVITNSSGQVIGSSQYEPYGARRAVTGTKLPVGYIGQHEDESSYLFLNARYMDPTVGRFLSPDPIFAPTRRWGLDPYAYAAFDPINRLDPTGAADEAVEGVDWGYWTGLVRAAIGNISAFGAGFGVGNFQGRIPLGGIYRPSVGIDSPYFELGRDVGMIFGGAQLTSQGVSIAKGGAAFALGTAETGAGAIAGGAVAVGGVLVAGAGVVNAGIGIVRTAQDLNSLRKGDGTSTAKNAAEGVADEAHVVRGGIATPEQIAKGIGPHKGVPGLTGFSAQARTGASVEELASTGGVGGGPFPHGKISVTTAGELRCIGCEVVPSPGGGANHVTVVPGTATSGQISDVFEILPNPAR
jgi:RHS repeat-associated protein